MGHTCFTMAPVVACQSRASSLSLQAFHAARLLQPAVSNLRAGFAAPLLARPDPSSDDSKIRSSVTSKLSRCTVNTKYKCRGAPQREYVGVTSDLALMKGWRLIYVLAAGDSDLPTKTPVGLRGVLARGTGRPVTAWRSGVGVRIGHGEDFGVPPAMPQFSHSRENRFSRMCFRWNCLSHRGHSPYCASKSIAVWYALSEIL